MVDIFVIIGMVEFELFANCMKSVFLLLLLLLLPNANALLLFDCVNIMAYESENNDAAIIKNIDDIVEHARTLNGKSLGTLAEFIEHGSIQKPRKIFR